MVSFVGRVMLTETPAVGEPDGVELDLDVEIDLTVEAIDDDEAATKSVTGVEALLGVLGLGTEGVLNDVLVVGIDDDALDEIVKVVDTEGVIVVLVVFAVDVVSTEEFAGGETGLEISVNVELIEAVIFSYVLVVESGELLDTIEPDVATGNVVERDTEVDEEVAPLTAVDDSCTPVLSGIFVCSASIVVEVSW